MNDNWWKLGGVIILLMVIGAGLEWFGTGLDYAQNAFWQPKQQNLQRQIFQNTQSYTQGMAQDLGNLHVQYVQTTDPQARTVIVNTVRTRSAGVNLLTLNDPDLESWVQGCRDGSVQ